VAAETYEIEKGSGAVHASKGVEAYRNPSYPERDHFSERSRLEEALRTSEQRVDAARRQLEAGGDLAGKADTVRLYHQLLGVRDQIAECVRRIPLEAGELYEEDKERFAHAIAALERVWALWERTRGEGA
jgi:hypothetical protein